MESREGWWRAGRVDGRDELLKGLYLQCAIVIWFISEGSVLAPLMKSVKLIKPSPSYNNNNNNYNIQSDQFVWSREIWQRLWGWYGTVAITLINVNNITNNHLFRKKLLFNSIIIMTLDYRYWQNTIIWLVSRRAIFSHIDIALWLLVIWLLHGSYQFNLQAVYFYITS